MAQNDRAFRVKTGIELETLGSNTAPVYSFSGDPNTGIYSSTADNLDVTAGGTQIINATSTVVTFKGTAVANYLKLTEDGTTGGFLLSLFNNSGLTADRTLTFNVNNANRTISLSADLTVANTASVSGTNTGDQNIIQTIAVGADSGYTWGSASVVADTTSDTVTLVPEVGVNINTDSTLDAIKIGVRTGSTSQTGILQLTDSTSSTSTTTAATPNSVKSTYDAAVLKSGSTSTGKQTFAAPAVGNASILLPNGAADPSSPVSGDMWVNAGVMKYYNGSATKTIPFSDGTIQVATTITVGSDASDTTCYPVFVNSASASNQGAKYNSNLAFDALNNVLSVAGGAVLSSGGALGTTAGNSLTPLKVEVTSANADKLHAVIERQSDGATSATARWKIKRTVDTTDAGFITLGNSNVVTFGKNATTYATFYDGGHLLINTGTDDAVNFLQVAGGISAALGSNTAPGYTFAGDLNTGIYSSGADNVSITTGGTQRVSVASSGDVSITSTTASSSTITGALIVGGGIGVAGTSYIGGVLNLSNDLAVNGGDITTNQTTFNLINATATTLNVGGAATTVNIGSSTAVTNFTGTGAIKLPVGTDGQRPTAAQGMVRYNTTMGGTEVYDGSNWVKIGGSATTISLTAPTNPAPKAGDMWWENENGELFVYYTDADTSQWVSIIGRNTFSTFGDITVSGTLTLTGNVSANSLTISPTEVGYLDGVSSNIQTQINALLPKAGGTMTGDVDFDNNDLAGLKTATFDAVVTASQSTSSITIDWTTGFRQKSTLTAAITSITFTAPAGPANLIWVVTPNTYALSGFPAAVDWGDQGAPTMADGQRFVLMFYYDGTTYFGSYLKGYAE
jgi:hypothetical protein